MAAWRHSLSFDRHDEPRPDRPRLGGRARLSGRHVFPRLAVLRQGRRPPARRRQGRPPRRAAAHRRPAVPGKRLQQGQPGNDRPRGARGGAHHLRQVRRQGRAAGSHHRRRPRQLPGRRHRHGGRPAADGASAERLRAALPGTDLAAHLHQPAPHGGGRGAKHAGTGQGLLRGRAAAHARGTEPLLRPRRRPRPAAGRRAARSAAGVPAQLHHGRPHVAPAVPGPTPDRQDRAAHPRHRGAGPVPARRAPLTCCAKFASAH
ncbi:conserved hypothetical protein [Ricinus communis]|uniref:Uncharacterized protein n=1 Tax=Ricinus communis TaxID=3988 RepID=B9TGP1_RICCO|nr:conserved hypothetical protein [Ricinus communis]